MKHTNLNNDLRGFTNLVRLCFSVEPNSGVCNLTLDLIKDGSEENIRAEFLGVANLHVEEFGGGVTQLLHLVIEDISDRQLDRINYQVREVERDVLSFVCQTAVITSVV